MFPSSRHPFLAACFHLATLAILGAAIWGLLPAAVARNSEGFAAVLLVAFGLQYLRVDRRARSGLMWIAFLVAAFVITGPWRDVFNLADSVATLQEAFAAAAVLTAYLMRPRGWLEQGHHPPMISLYAVTGLLFVLGALNWGGQVIADHAETLALVLLLAAYLDFIGAAAPLVRMIWVAAMALTPLVYTAFNRLDNDVAAATNLWETSLVWLQRTTEAFVAVIILQLYVEIVAMLRGRTLRSVEIG